MKRAMIFIILTGMLFTGCSMSGDINSKLKSPGYPETETTRPKEEEPDRNKTETGEKNPAESEKVYSDYMKLVNSGKKPFELIAYMDREIGKVAGNRADEMILALEEVQDMYEDFYQQKFFNEDYVGELNQAAEKGTNRDILERIKTEGLKSLAKEIFDGGYKLISVEGSVYPVIDYSFLKKYYSSISAEVADYIEIMAMQSDRAAAKDAALVISWDELAQRLLKIEAYTGKYTGSARVEKLEKIYYNYMMMYLVGLNNTPAYDYQSKVYKEEVIKSFESLVESQKNSRSAGIVKQFMEILKKNGNKISDEARDYAENLYAENLSPEGKYGDPAEYRYTHAILEKLLPQKEGYRWLYNGFAEYGHRMTLEGIVREDGQIQYIIKGEVADMSGGESGKGEDYYRIDLMYTIRNSAILQTKSENIMMDSEFDSLELIRGPLLKGNKWMQQVKDKSGKDRYLNCEITDVNEVGGSKVYTIEYRDQDSDYYEVRMMEEGVGVVSFTKLWESKEGNFEIGYGLYKEMSGY